VRIAICALTYRRPAGLQRLLDAIVELEMPETVTCRLIIVDNDAERSGEPIVDGWEPSSPCDVVYLCQPAKNISLARNTAVDTARTWCADMICFIDDDEWPDVRWLVNLVRAQRSTGADVVTGPVAPSFEATPPDWIVTGGFFERPTYPQHSEIGYATTSNVLIRTSSLHGVDGPFDPGFGVSGGEDTLLFAQLARSGCRIVWAQDALVHESIPPSRVDVRWLLTREYRRGQTLSLVLRSIDPRASRIARRCVNASFQILMGMVKLIAGSVRGRAAWMKGAKQAALGVGMMSGLLGLRYQEYRTTHGR
jgi:glycosyltransferase involved in cell wall biosynthesis